MEEYGDIESLCNACQCPLATTEARNAHYRTDWHRYNVKRRCAELPPIPEALFLSKFNLVKAMKDKKAEQDNTVLTCPLTKRTFKSQAAFDHFLRSKEYKKAQEKAAAKLTRPAPSQAPALVVNEDGVVVDKVLFKAPAAGADYANPDEDALLAKDRTQPAVSSATPDDNGASASAAAAFSSAAAAAVAALSTQAAATSGATAIPLRYSLFDRVGPFSSVKASLGYMWERYGFYLPFVDHLVDLEGLLAYLGAKVGLGHACLLCHRQFRSARDAQQHMRDKGHCAMSLTDEEGKDDQDILEFFEFDPANMSDDEEEDDEEEAAAAGADEEDDGLFASSAAAAVIAAAAASAGGAGAGDDEEHDDDSAAPVAPTQAMSDAAEAAGAGAGLPGSGKRLPRAVRIRLREAQRLRTMTLLQLSRPTPIDAEEEAAEADNAGAGAKAVVEYGADGSRTYTGGVLTVARAKNKTVSEINGLGELVMSDGSILGHRAYKHLYKQPARVQRESGEEKKVKESLLAHYYALQLPGYSTNSLAYRDATQQQLKEASKKRMYHAQKTGINNNILIKRWFRYQCPK